MDQLETTTRDSVGMSTGRGIAIAAVVIASAALAVYFHHHGSTITSAGFIVALAIAAAVGLFGDPDNDSKVAGR